jgi:hypothetical protein
MQALLPFLIQSSKNGVILAGSRSKTGPGFDPPFLIKLRFCIKNGNFIWDFQ